MSAEIPNSQSPSTEPAARRSLLLVLPVLVFVALAVVFFLRLRSGADPQAIPSALIGKAVPAFRLEPVPGLADANGAVPGLSSEDLKGKPTLLNFFASWCAPCQVEHPMLMRLAHEADIRVVGIDYKDAPEAARRFLGRNGVPYAGVGADTTGRVAIDFGVYGVPESFIVGPDGVIRDKLVGIVTPETYPQILARIRAAGKVAAAGAP